MRRTIVLLGTVVAMLIPAAALAAPPVVVADGEATFSDVIPAGEVCDFEITLEQVEHFRVTEYYDNDGSLTRVRQHVRGMTTYVTEHGEAWERWSYSFVIDPETGIVTQPGNVFNIHAGAGGILVNDSGRLILAGPGVALVINGPHQAWDGDFDDFCAALAP